MTRRLPLLVEHAVRTADAQRTQLSSEFEAKVRQGPSVTCQKGCHHCCYHPIMLSLFEGISLYRWLLDSRAWTTALRSKFVEVSSQTWNLPLEVWILSLIPCPLLDQKHGLCQAYDGRPLQCRATFSTADPYYCHPHRLGLQTGILPRQALITEQESAEKALLKRLHIGHVRVPLAKAVLIGERICTQDLDMADAPMELWQDLLQNG